MATMDLDQVQAQLPELIAGLNPGEPLTILRDGKPVATLTRNERQEWPCKAGSGKTEGFWMAPDFDEPLEVFREYME